MTETKIKVKFVSFPLGHGYGEVLGVVLSSSRCSPQEHMFFFFGSHFLIYDHGTALRWELIQILKPRWKSGKYVNCRSRSIAFSSRIADLRAIAKKILKQEIKARQ